MTSDRTYEVVLRRNIPFLSKLLNTLFIISAVVLVVCWALSEFWLSSHILVFSLIVTIISGILLFRLRRRVKATLTFQRTGISIVWGGDNIYVAYSSIVKILCSDLTNWRGESNQQFQIILRQKGRRVTSFRLADYSEVEDIIHELSGLEGIPILFYERAFIEDDEKENAISDLLARDEVRKDDQ